MTSKINNLINKIVMAEITCILEILAAPILCIMAVFKKDESALIRFRLILQIILDFFGVWFMMLYMPYRILKNYKEEK